MRRRNSFTALASPCHEKKPGRDFQLSAGVRWPIQGRGFQTVSRRTVGVNWPVPLRTRLELSDSFFYCLWDFFLLLPRPNQKSQLKIQKSP
jgi:hypothetical protein